MSSFWDAELKEVIGYHKEIDLWVHGEMRQIHRRSKGEDTWEPAEKKDQSWNLKSIYIFLKEVLMRKQKTQEEHK